MIKKSSINALSAAILITLTTGCGGGGGGGDGGNNEPRETNNQLTPLPAFIASSTAECAFVEGGNTVSLENYRGTLANVTELNCDNASLANLNGIEQLTALVSLSLTNSGLTSISELLNNRTITQLNLSGNPLTDLSALNSMTGVTNLNLSDTGLGDLAPLLDMINLLVLNLEDNPITEFSALASLTGLIDLDMSNTDAQDTSALSTLTALQSLDLSHNQIQLITELANLVELTSLDLSHNRLQDVMPLAGLTELVQVLLNVNSTLDCSNVYQLEDAIVNDAIQSVPSACDTAYVLGESSAETDSFDNSQLAEPYGRVVIIGEYTLEDLLLIKSGDDLALRLTTDSGDRTVTFTNWYLDEANEVSIFELPDGEEYIFANLRTHVALAQELTEQADEFTGSDQPDVIYGLGGNDTLMGNNGADTLIGGPGNDWLIGNTARLDQDGNPTTTTYADSSIDVYVYNTGDGNDVIYAGYSSASDNRDLLKFNSNISPNDIQLRRDGSHLIFFFDEENSITIYNWFTSSTGYRIGYIQFGDNESLEATLWVNSRPITIANPGSLNGTDENNILQGTSGQDVIQGHQGADTIVGGPGNDWLIGNTARLDQDGNPTTTIYADSSIDVYVYNTGDGNDVIYAGYSSASDNRDLLKFGPGITSTDITVTQSGNNVVLTLPDGGSVTVYSWFENANYRLGTIQFDGQDPIDATEFVEANLP